MMISADRAEKLTQYLIDDKERAKIIFGLPLTDALARINADGYDFTEEELKKYTEYIVDSFDENDNEVSEKDLLGINGGLRCFQLSAMFKQCGISSALFNWMASNNN